MQATRLEYRLRFLLHGIIFFLGFYAPWNGPLHLTDDRIWTVLAGTLAHAGWLTFFAAAQLLLALSLVFLALAAWLRTWGAAYVGADVVRSRSMHGETMLADGPYRRTRNPLYLGTLLHTIGISLLMSPSGAVFAIVLIWILQIRLALAEEPFLASRFGQPYLDYKQRVPRFLPSPTPLIPAAGQPGRWLLAILGEFYFIAAFCVIAFFGWQFNARPIYRGLLISLGLWIIIYALLPRAKQETAA